MKSQSDSPNVIAFPPLIYASGLFIGFLLRNIQPYAVFESKLTLLGWSLIGISVVVASMAVKFFAQNKTNVNVRKPTTTIVVEGPYRFTRNPMYLSMAMFYLGLSILANDYWFFVVLVPVLLVIRYGVIAREEKYLTNKFGEEYTKYKKSVRRWL